jgi:hypothetical protein
MGEGELELCLPSPIFGRGAGGEGKDLSLHWDAPLGIANFFNIYPRIFYIDPFVFAFLLLI